jgi:hypothetical protein
MKPNKVIKSRSLLTSLICLLIIQSSFSQPANRQIVTQPSEWFAVTSNLKVTKRLIVMLDGQFRYIDGFQPQQYQARTALEIKINDHLLIAPLGYVYTWNYLYGKQPAAFANNEHRIWQQITYKHAAGKIFFNHRFRLEERFIEKRTLGGDGSVIYDGYTLRQTRVRYRIMTNIPLNNKKMEPKTVFLSVFDEAFLSWGDNITFHEPDQNRIFTGLGYQFDPSFTIQTGFIYQMLIKANGAKQENNLGFLVQLNCNLDLTK